MTTIAVPAQPAVDDDLLERVAWLDLSDAQHRFASGVAADAPYYLAEQARMEYRRFLLAGFAPPTAGPCCTPCTGTGLSRG